MTVRKQSKMQYREELSFLGWKARLCSLPTTRCDPFTSSTKPSHIIHVQIKFPAEVQFQIHKTAKLKQEKDRQYHWTFAKYFQIICCVFWTKVSKTLDTSFQCLDCKNFSGGNLHWLWNSNIESQTVAIQHCYYEFLSLMFNWSSVWTRRHDIGISIFIQMFDVMFQFNHEQSVVLVS